MMLIVLTGLSTLSGLLENLNIGIIMPHVKCDLDISATAQSLLTSVPFLVFVQLSISGVIWLIRTADRLYCARVLPAVFCSHFHPHSLLMLFR